MAGILRKQAEKLGKATGIGPKIHHGDHPSSLK